MSQPLPDAALDQLFRTARTYNGYLDRPVTTEQLHAIWDLMKMGPTSANMMPARLVWCVSQEAKDKLASCAGGTNPDKIRQALKANDRVKRIAAKYAECDNFLYLGRQFNFPTALEGALKLKEISYIHAEAYPAAEMKHGPIALVDGNTPSVFLMPHGPVYDKVMSNLQEIKARGGPVIAVVCEGDTRVADLADDVIEVPHGEDFLQPIVTIIPLQHLAYHIAVLRGCDVDKPRNLAKSVTVE